MACQKVSQDYHKTTFKTFVCWSQQLLMRSLRKTTVSLCWMLLSEFVHFQQSITFDKGSRKTFSSWFCELRFYIFSLWFIVNTVALKSFDNR